MEHRAILHIASRADVDTVDIPAQYGIRPHRGLCLDLDIANDDSRLIDPCIGRYARLEPLITPYIGHRAILLPLRSSII